MKVTLISFIYVPNYIKGLEDKVKAEVSVNGTEFKIEDCLSEATLAALRSEISIATEKHLKELLEQPI